MTENYTVKTDKLTKIYGKGETAVKALDSVEFSVKHGEFVAVTGASGSGKSTLLHIIGAMDKPTSGKVFVDGEDVFAQSEKSLALYRRRKTGFIFQNYNLIPVMTVRENILLPLTLDNTEPDEAMMKELIEMLELESRLSYFPNQLSGGQQQRVAIARALIACPSIILADEPTGNLDTQNSREIIALMKQTIKKYSQTLILITHDPNIAFQADRVVNMSDGRLAEA